MTRVAITWYENSHEHTIWDEMPQVPVRGDSFSLSDGNTPTMTVRHVAWVRDLPFQKGAWHAEITLGAS